MAGRQCQRLQVLRLHPTQPRGPAEMPPCASSASVIVGLASDRIGAGATSPFRYIAHHLIENTLLVSSSHTPYLPTLFSPALCVQVFLCGPRRAPPVLVLSAAVSSSATQPILPPNNNVTFDCAASRTLPAQSHQMTYRCFADSPRSDAVAPKSPRCDEFTVAQVSQKYDVVVD
jgi:hypothetical protein